VRRLQGMFGFELSADILEERRNEGGIETQRYFFH
jgi:hypothetical protein